MTTILLDTTVELEIDDVLDELMEKPDAVKEFAERLDWDVVDFCDNAYVSYDEALERLAEELGDDSTIDVLEWDIDRFLRVHVDRGYANNTSALKQCLEFFSKDVIHGVMPPSTNWHNRSEVEHVLHKAIVTLAEMDASESPTIKVAEPAPQRFTMAEFLETVAQESA